MLSDGWLICEGRKCLKPFLGPIRGLCVHYYHHIPFAIPSLALINDDFFAVDCIGDTKMVTFGKIYWMMISLPQSLTMNMFLKDPRFSPPPISVIIN